jgi:bifunctional non-homologous end joining protein LigD
MCCRECIPSNNSQTQHGTRRFRAGLAFDPTVALYVSAMLYQRTFPAGFIAPCLPIKAHTAPSGSLWLHEIKHDARKGGERVRLYSRPGNDLTYRFPLIVEAVSRLRSRSCVLDGEAVACDDDGRPSFDRIRYRRYDASVFLYAFDLIELNGDDLRRDPLEVRKATLASVLTNAGPGLRLNEHIEHDDGETVFRHACKMGLEGIVSKRKGSPYRSGRSPDWLKMKNPNAPAVTREIGRRLGALTTVTPAWPTNGASASRRGSFRSGSARLGRSQKELPSRSRGVPS